MNQNISLTDKLVGEIKGRFVIPSYQRGYRWTKSEVEALLDDIYSLDDKETYCLQPIVVCSHDDGTYELVDGQQRLTTILIIYKYMGFTFQQIAPGFSLEYETRDGNSDFFDHLGDASLAGKNIDFWFIHNAYLVVKDWFESKGNANYIFLVPRIFGRLQEQVKVIWYELHSSSRDEAIALFTRLNIGRIPLTNAELVKALFLSRNRGISSEQQMEISLQWDTIERELQNEDLRSFLTPESPKSYPTRIELIFNFIAHKRTDDREKLKTFLHFSSSTTPILEQWNNIRSYYYRLKEWWQRNDDGHNTLYHKIGYLVASRTCTIDELMDATKAMRKSEMEAELDRRIRESIACDNYAELSYEDNAPLISKILLLFNVMSMVEAGVGARFPFKEYNNETWSLEHIHAQQSLQLNTQDKWREWLSEHLISLESLAHSEKMDLLVNDTRNAIEAETLTLTMFNALVERITDALTVEGEQSELHSLSNMALLPVGANAALKNYLFDAKRRKIREMDSKGRFIPYCTKMVFMKYFSSEKLDSVSYHYWSRKDREIYIMKMNEVLKPYLEKEIEYADQ